MLLPACVRPSVRPSAHPSVRPSINPSVRKARDTDTPKCVFPLCVPPKCSFFWFCVFGLSLGHTGYEVHI